MDLIGRTIGQYQILDEIGRGGMAVVYKAWQPSLNRYVALKVLPPQFTFDREFVERFLREAQAAAGLRHPNIVVIYDVGRQDDTFYIVMEYLEGRTLKQLIEEEGPLPPARVGHIVAQVAAALDYAHQRGFVHRDVKPANIFVGPDDRVTLTDFGIAKAAWNTHLTRTGMLIGTPEYMSPEQARGEEVDARTDLYSLGIVAYEMLTGRVPFGGTTPHAVLHQQIYEPPPPLRSLRPGSSPAVDEILNKALAKQPADRYVTAGDFARALDRVVAQIEAHRLRQQVAEAAAWIAEGRYDEATTRLEALAQMYPDDKEIAAALANARQQARLAALYAEVQQLWAQARTKAEELLAAAPRYPDPDGLLPRLSGRKPEPGAGQHAGYPAWLWAGAGLAAIALIVLVILATGGRQPAINPEATAQALARLWVAQTALAAPISTHTPAPATDTPVPTPTPSLPVLSGTPFPRPAAPISPDNADRVTQLARWGRGTVSRVAYSPDGALLAVASSLGIYLYDAGTLEEVRFIETGTWINSVAFSPDGATVASGSRDGTVRLWGIP